MPTGLLIDLNDGGPRMEISSGLRCPSFCQNVAEAWDTNQYTLNQRVAGSQIVVIPRNTVWSGQRGTNLVPTIGMFDGFSVSGNTITLNTWWSDNWGRARSFSSAVWQILPASQGRGLFIQNSTDFLSITDSTMAGYCIWRGTVTVSGIWQTPVNSEAEGISISRLNVGEYQLTGAAGLAVDGWRLLPPRDPNGSGDLGIVEAEESANGIVVRLYKRKYALSAVGDIELIKGALIDVPPHSWIDIRIGMPADSIWNLAHLAAPENQQDVQQ